MSTTEKEEPGIATQARDESAFLSRRDSLKTIARFAAATAPAMAVLLSGTPADACDHGNDHDNGNHNGWGKGGRHSKF